MITDREALESTIDNSIYLCNRIIESKNKSYGITACLTCKYKNKGRECWILLLKDRVVDMHNYLSKR